MDIVTASSSPQSEPNRWPVQITIRTRWRLGRDGCPLIWYAPLGTGGARTERPVGAEYHRDLKLARTSADGVGREQIEAVHLAQALQYTPKAPQNYRLSDIGDQPEMGTEETQRLASGRDQGLREQGVLESTNHYCVYVCYLSLANLCHCV